MPKVILHIGAHKPATTYLQARLAKSANPLRQMQVGYVDLKLFRAALDRAGGLRRCQHRYALLSQRALKAELSGLVQREHALGAERIVLEERIRVEDPDLSNGGLGQQVQHIGPRASQSDNGNGSRLIPTWNHKMHQVVSPYIFLEF